MATLNPKAVLQTSSGGGAAGVSSLNGESGALNLKTIGGQDPLGVGDIPTGGTGSGSQLAHTNYLSATQTYSETDPVTSSFALGAATSSAVNFWLYKDGSTS